MCYARKFRANLSQLVFTDYFLQLSTMMPTDFVYGLGERWGPLRRSVNWTHYYFFAKGGWPGVKASAFQATHVIGTLRDFHMLYVARAPPGIIASQRQGTTQQPVLISAVNDSSGKIPESS
ncbi:hypothetical protein HPB48_012032 [Haemaphysalis longicornis]|uniref:Uncharacterized protein n=1 Tax=Haemaphysalis longicornis TaxID=44386 RepID=A0A9J6GFD5_HAELO|nr:hypothetical protein HPB48_012032 [Haemaphysalis longicornis]